ncbi:FAD-binding protein [Cupriavidus sp. U2]|uniref:FAD-binding protein n=1 Tax=Cupriavidus sp. U2 TaxID=2920269 RepID=UPI001892A267|nr:FAD-binding protein [Cupriavidus sp. U2]
MDKAPHKFDQKYQCDILVVGSGAAGFAAAISARKAGLEVLMIEKAGCFGGTTATSGGYLWIPGNPVSAAAGIPDSHEEIRRYLRAELGDAYNEALIESFLRYGPEMIDFFVNQLGVELYPATKMPDYHPTRPGGSAGGRSLHAKPVSGAILGKELRRLRPLPRELSLFGMGVSSGSDLGHLYKFGRSLNSTVRVAFLLARYSWHKLRYGRGLHLVNGNALIARLARVLFDLKIPLWTNTAASSLLFSGNEVSGARVVRDGQPVQVLATKGVILASGGFAHDIPRRRAVYSHPAGSGEHISLTAPGNEGDGARLAESAGGWVDTSSSNGGAWMPISKVPRPDGTWGGIIHSVNQGKPGVIAVLRSGHRFVDESLPYHDFVEHMIRAGGKASPVGAFIICDQKAFKKYGLGYAKPFLPLDELIASKYLHRADTIGDLARSAGIDVPTLERTVASYNLHARSGEDPEFGKGRDEYGNFLGDLSHTLNPNIAPLEDGPFYAVWMYPGDIGTFAGIKTDAYARVVRSDQSVVSGLYAVGNDMASVFCGRYPGGGSLIGPGMTFGYLASRVAAGLINTERHCQNDDLLVNAVARCNRAERLA